MKYTWQGVSVNEILIGGKIQKPRTVLAKFNRRESGSASGICSILIFN
jgi:hypothetical protein